MCWWVHRAHTQPPPLCGHLTFISFFASHSYRPPPPPPHTHTHTHTHTHFWQHFIYVSFSQYCPNETRDKHKNQTMKKNRCFMFRKLEMLQVTKKKKIICWAQSFIAQYCPNETRKKHKNQLKKENYCFVFRKLENNVASNKKKLITCWALGLTAT